jgi:hypothetical protein
VDEAADPEDDLPDQEGTCACDRDSGCGRDCSCDPDCFGGCDDADCFPCSELRDDLCSCKDVRVCGDGDCFPCGGASDGTCSCGDPHRDDEGSGGSEGATCKDPDCFGACDTGPFDGRCDCDFDAGPACHDPDCFPCSELDEVLRNGGCDCFD